MPFIWKKIKNFLSFDPLNDNEKYFWFEHNKIPISWNYPVGVLFDGLLGRSSTFATTFEDQLKDEITILRIRLVMGDSPPPTIIPITISKTQVEKYWFHPVSYTHLDVYKRQPLPLPDIIVLYLLLFCFWWVVQKNYFTRNYLRGRREKNTIQPNLPYIYI